MGLLKSNNEVFTARLTLKLAGLRVDLPSLASGQAVNFSSK